MVERGAYLTVAAGCVSCHWDRKGGGARFAGGRALKTPFGTFYSPNITPDIATGIGAWSDDEFLDALLDGTGSHGEQLYPVFPYTSYSHMRVSDALAIKAYLFSLQPVKARNRPHQLQFPFTWRGLMKGWKLLFFQNEIPGTPPTEPVEVARGRYLAQALGHCGECHTPRNVLGAMDSSAFLRGNPKGPEGWAVPALVGPSKSDFAHWSVEEIEEYLKSGVKPDFDSVQGPMAEVIEDNTKLLTAEDRNAIARYLKSLNQ
ncbi:MAG: cytochrome c [Micropepsaceae bacterium]